MCEARGPTGCHLTLVLYLAVTGECISRCFLPRAGTEGLGFFGTGLPIQPGWRWVCR